MKAVVRSISSPDLDVELYEAGDEEAIYAFVELRVGIADEDEGADIFGVVVCSPAGLARIAPRMSPMFMRHHLLVEEWNWPVIRDFIVKIVEQQEAPTWDEVAAKISRYAQWEFEDYRPYAGDA